MKRFPMFFAVAAVSVIAASGAFAQETGGVEINGFASNTAVANGNVNVATGGNSKARQSIGSVHAAEVNGFLANTTVANGNANVAAGGKTRACQQIGTIGRYRHEDDENKFC